MHDMEKGLIELFSHSWTSETLKQAEEERRIVTEDGGLTMEIIRREREQTASGRGWYTLTRRYTLRFTAEAWAALKRCVCQEKKCGEERARELLLLYMESSLPRHRDRTNRAPLAACGAALAGLMLVILLSHVLTAMLHARDIVAKAVNESAGIPASAYLAGLMLFALLMALRFTRGMRNGRLCRELWALEGPALDERLRELVPQLDCTRLSAVNRPLAAVLAVGCVGFTVLTLLPADAKMPPAEQLAYYFEDITSGKLDKAASSAMRMQPEAVVDFLQGQIEDDQYFPGDESFYAGILAVRLHQQGHLTQEQAAPLAEGALKLVKLKDITNTRQEYLPELISGCSPEYQRAYLLGLNGKGFIGESTLTAIGQGVKGLDMATLAEGYARLQKTDMNAGALLGGAVGTAGSIEEAERLLRETPEEYRAAMADAYAQGLETTDNTLAYLRMLLTLGLTDEQLSAIPLEFAWDAGNLLIDAQPSGKLPDGEYTILPLVRVEELEAVEHQQTILLIREEEEVLSLFPTHDEDDADKQSVTLALGVYAALPPERVPVSAAEADVILLFDQQYQIGGFQASETLSNRLGEDYVFPKFDCVQRVSLYDARTGKCLMELGSKRTSPKALTEAQMGDIWEAGVFRYGYTTDMKQSCHGTRNSVWYNRMVQQVIEAAEGTGKVN